MPKIIKYAQNQGVLPELKLWRYNCYIPVDLDPIMENEKIVHSSHTLFERFSNTVSWFTSTSYAFTAASFLVLLWLGSGFILHWGDRWLSIIGAITSVITFLMVFIIQKSQNKESKAIQLKLNELLAASTHASNRLVGIEEMPEEELERIYEHFRALVEVSYKKSKFNVSHSIEKTLEEEIPPENTGEVKNNQVTS